jgi:hypothetical protein
MNQEEFWAKYPWVDEKAKELFHWIFQYQPEKRPTLEEIINHPWM